jgi:hypothetical protein
METPFSNDIHHKIFSIPSLAGYKTFLFLNISFSMDAQNVFKTYTSSSDPEHTGKDDPMIGKDFIGGGIVQTLHQNLGEDIAIIGRDGEIAWSH